METFSGSSSNLQDSRPFFTEESYNRLSVKPSLESFLKECNSKSSNVDFQGLKTDSELKSPKLGCPFPRKSNLTLSQQRAYLELYYKFSTYQLQCPSKQDLNEIEHFKKLQMLVGQEQEEFMSYLRSIAIDHPEDYSFINSKVNQYMKRYLECSLKRLYSIPRYYILQQTLSLRAGAVYRTDAVMKFIKYLLIVGERKGSEPPCLSSYKSIMRNQTINQAIVDQIACKSHQELNCDTRIVDMVAENPVDFVISSEALLTLLDNHPPDYDQQWEIPVTIQRQQKGSAMHKVVVIDAPLVKKTYMPKVQNTLYHTQVMKQYLLKGRETQNKQSEPETKKHKATENSISVAQPKTLKTNETEFDFENELGINHLETFGCGSSKRLFPKEIQSKLMTTKSSNTSSEQIQEATKCQEYTTSQEICKNSKQHQDDNLVNIKEGSAQQTLANKSFDSNRPDLSNSEMESQPNITVCSPLSPEYPNQDYESQPDNISNSSSNAKDESVGQDKQKKSIQRSGAHSCTKEKLISDSSDTEHELVIAFDSTSSHDETDENTIQKDPSQLRKRRNTGGSCHRDYTDGVITRSRSRTKADNHEMKIESNDECHSKVNQNTEHNGTVVDETVINGVDNTSPLRRSKRLKGLHGSDAAQKNVICVAERLKHPNDSRLEKINPNIPENDEVKIDDEENMETSIEESDVCESKEDSCLMLTPLSPDDKEDSCLMLTPLSPDDKDRGIPVHVQQKQFSKHVSSEGSENDTIHQDEKISSRSDAPSCPDKGLIEGDAQRHPEETINTLNDDTSEIKHENENMLQTQSPPRNDPEEGEVIYSLWSFGKFKILVKTQIDGRSNVVQAQQNVPLYIQPKLEYQAAFGHEQLTVSEVCQGWLKLFLTPGAQLIRGRINVMTSDLMKVEYVELKSVLTHLVPFNPGQSMKMLHSCLKNLSCLSEGQYLVSHNAGDLHACIYQRTDPAAKKSCYDLHSIHQKHQLGRYNPTTPPWLPLDPNLPLQQHINQSRIPATFPPKSPDMTNFSKPVKGAGNASSKKNKKKMKLQSV